MCKIGFSQLTSRQGEHVYDCVGIRSNQLRSVKRQEQFHGDECRSFVAVDKWMVAGNAKSVTCRQVSRVWITVMGELLRPRQGRFQQICVAHASAAAMLGKLLVVHCMNQAARKPAPFAGVRVHLANSRSTSLRFFMMRRASDISASKSGL